MHKKGTNEIEKTKRIEKDNETCIPNHHHPRDCLPFHDSHGGFYFLPLAEHIDPLQKPDQL